MAFEQHGNQDYQFGFHDADAATIADVIGLKPQTLSLSYEPEFVAKALDENGEVASMVVGQDKVNFTMSGYVVDPALLKAATAFEYDGWFLVITSKKYDESNTDFGKGEVSGEGHKGIDAPPP